jgi:hypothetical protein
MNRPWGNIRTEPKPGEQTFRCGHPRYENNAKPAGPWVTCRICAREHARAWRARDRKARL